MSHAHCQQFGFTVVELVVATTILLVLSGMVIPVARVTIKREKERQLRHALWELRDAIDATKMLQIEVHSPSRLARMATRRT
jgi:prepilin-type N-terminal cleavage/methylation domain-containing protein